MVHVVLLSGGSGARLWPLSTPSRPKQFLKVLPGTSDERVSMAQRVFSQIAHVHADVDVTIATGASQTELIASQLAGQYALSIEPMRRDTAPAIMLACAHLDMVQGASYEDPVIVMPIDTFAEQAYYDRVADIAEAVGSGASDLVLLGVKPTHPSEKYGYIVPAATEGDAWPVERFHEKPDARTARSLMERGCLWNCGVFGFRLGWLRALTKAYADAGSFEEMVDRYGELPAKSFDYEVVERAESVSVLPYEGTWKDLGTWDALAEELGDGAIGDVWVDELSVRNVCVINETDVPVVVSDIANAVVVATSEGILVTGMEGSSRIKSLVECALRVSCSDDTV